MALLATEGFDHYASFNDVALRTGVLQFSSHFGCSIVTGRNGVGKALSLFNDVLVSFNVSNQTMTVGWAMGTRSSPPLDVQTNTVSFIDGSVGGGTQCEVVFNCATGVISLWRGAGTTLLSQTLGNAFNIENYPTIEIQVNVHNTAGAIEVRVNGATPAGASVSGVNTRGGSTNNAWSAVACSSSADDGFRIDDFRLTDTTIGPGTFPCDGFLGDVLVAPIYPVGNGAVAWTPLANTNWQEVSETAFDGDASYNSTSNNGDEDLFNLGTLSAATTAVIGVQVIGAYRETTASGHTLSQQLKIGGTDHAGATNILATNYAFFSDIFPVNPTTGVSWSLTDILTLEIGYKAVS
jgi:hypothetical protein